MLIKMIAAVMIVTASTLTGVRLADRHKRRVVQLQRLIAGLTMLAQEIAFTRTPLPQAFAGIGEKTAGAVGSLFYEAGVLLSKKTGHTAGGAFRAALARAARRDLALTADDREILTAFSQTLGATDADGQARHIALALERLKANLAQAEAERDKTRKLYTNLGALGGVFVVILLI